MPTPARITEMRWKAIVGAIDVHLNEGKRWDADALKRAAQEREMFQRIHQARILSNGHSDPFIITSKE